MFPGVGTLVNVATVLLGAGLGVALGHRLPQRTRDVVTDGLGLVTLVIALLSAFAVTDRRARRRTSAPALRCWSCWARSLVGGIIGSLLHLERRVEGVGGWLQGRLTSEAGSAERHRFIEGFVASSLVFCTGPLTILGSLNDGLGRGADQLYLKAALDGFAAIAFAASFGWGVAASALTVARGAGRPHRWSGCCWATCCPTAVRRRPHRDRRGAAGRRRAAAAPDPRDPGRRPAPRTAGGTVPASAAGCHASVTPRQRTRPLPLTAGRPSVAIVPAATTAHPGDRNGGRMTSTTTTCSRGDRRPMPSALLASPR